MSRKPNDLQEPEPGSVRRYNFPEVISGLEDPVKAASKAVADLGNQVVHEPSNAGPTTEQLASQQGKKFFQYLATFVAGCVMAQSGMNLGWTSPVMPKLSPANESDPSTFPELILERYFDSDDESWLTSLMPLGAILGALPAGKLGDFIGRKYSMALTTIPFFICWLTLTFSIKVWIVFVARFIGGIGTGAACVLVPVYIGEIAEPSIRGALTTFFPISLSFGIFFAYVAGALLDYFVFNATCGAMLIPFLLGFIFLPETPSWLIQRGRKADACKVLKTLRGDQYDISEEISMMLEEAEQLQIKQGGLRDLLCTPNGKKAIFTSLGLMWFQQMCGIDAILFYTVTIFESAGSTINAYFATSILGAIEVIMGIVVAVTIDRFGRKPLLILSGTFMTVCLGVLGYYFRLQEMGEDISNIGWVPLTCLGMFNVVFSLGYGSIPYSIIGELFPPETKGVASSISIMTNWSLVFFVTKIFPYLEKYLGQAFTFWSFATISAMAAIFAFFVPETKGKTLQEIQAKLARRKRKKRRDVEALNDNPR